MDLIRKYSVTALLWCATMSCHLGCISNSTGPSVVHPLTQPTHTVTGILYRPDGVTPAAGATVLLRPRMKNTDLLVSGASAGGNANDSGSLTATTRADGTFQFEASRNYARLSLYATEADSQSVMIDSITNDTSVHVQGILKKPGTIQAVFPSLTPDGAILINGQFNFTGAVGTYDATGHVLTLKDLAEGHYDLTFVASWDPYIVAQKTNVNVVSEDTAFLDSITFPTVGIPRISKFESLSRCDIKTRVVTLRWETLDTSVISGYDVYRQDAASGAMIRLNDKPLIVASYLDSAFTDPKQHPIPAPQDMYRNSAGQPASVVLYHVRAVSKDGYSGQPAMYFAYFN